MLYKRLGEKDKKIVAEILKRGGVGVLPTDTLYGLVGSALKKSAVEKIYKLRRRDKNKPMIILISSPADLKLFGIRPAAATGGFLSKVWPGKVSVVLPCPSPKWKYLHRGAKTLAFRVPADKKIHKLLETSGPLVAPSANVAGQPESFTTSDAQRYFGNSVDFYLSAGKKKTRPSTLIKIENNQPIVLRQGAVKIK